MLIKNWEDLSKIPNESPTHYLEVDVEGGSAWLIAKKPKPYKQSLSYIRQVPHLDIYLSTHTFYGSKYKESTKILKVCGFNVELENWDKERKYEYES